MITTNINNTPDSWDNYYNQTGTPNDPSKWNNYFKYMAPVKTLDFTIKTHETAAKPNTIKPVTTKDPATHKPSVDLSHSSLPCFPQHKPYGTVTAPAFSPFEDDDRPDWHQFSHTTSANDEVVAEVII